MDWNKLYDMQAKLDKYIEDNHRIGKQGVFSKRLLALFVELGELANETRCFKFWSTKQPSQKDVILEEYVDVLHFMLSLGLDTGLRYNPARTVKLTTNKDTTTLFLELYQICTSFGDNPDLEKYNNMLDTYLILGKALHFPEEEIEGMYFKKNDTNYQRQDEGY